MGLDPVKSAERVLAILEHFRIRQAPASVTEICRALALPQSSTTMLLRSLVALGYLDHNPLARTYLPTLRVALLGDWLRTGAGPGGPLTARLEALHAATGETVILGRQNGAAVQYLQVVQTDQGVQLRVRAGVSRPLTVTALGRMLLAAKPDREALALVRRNNAEANDPLLRVNEGELLDELRCCRFRGYAISPGLVTAGASVIAMLVPGAIDGPRLAVGIGGPESRIRRRRADIITALEDVLAPAVRSGSLAVSAASSPDRSVHD